MLDLHQNNFQVYSAVPRAPKLDTISLGYNQLVDVLNLSNACNLTVLDLHSNKLLDLPESILQMGNLKTLTLTNNELRDLDPRVSLLEDLVRINIEGNPLKAIKPAMRSANAVQLKKYLKMRLGEDVVEREETKQSQARGIPTMSGGYDQWDMLIREFRQGTALDLRNKELTDFSPKVLELSDLTVLDLSGNPGITFLPQDIDMLQNLKTLRFQGNGLRDLPSSLLRMRNLQALELNANNIANFFETDSKTGAPIGRGDVQLDMLSYLSLNRNQIPKIPSICKYMPALKQLHLHQNKLTDIKELCRSEFAELDTLDVGNNRITEIPIALPYYLAKLTTLAAINNDLLTLPHWLGFHKSI